MNNGVAISAFTTKGNSIMFQLKNEVFVESNDTKQRFTALWDTGATNTSISKQVVSLLKLTPKAKMRIRTPSGMSIVNVYLVNIVLPNNVTMTNIEVCDSEIGVQGFDVLIGMDIITAGDFSVSNHNGKTAFSFRIPSRKTTDYVQEINIQNIIGTHGKGKKKRRK